MSISSTTELLHLAKGIRHYGARQNIDDRKNISKIIRLIQWRKYIQRQDLAKSLPTTNDVSIPEDAGFSKMDQLDKQVLANAAQSALRHWDNFDIDTELKKNIERPFIPQFLGDELKKDDPILKLALHPSVISAISKYIGVIPVIENITTWYSPNKSTISGSSQYYHLDGQDLRTIQIFLFLDDVTEDKGPLNIIRADDSETLAREINYKKTPKTKRIDDKIIEERDISVLKLTGEKNNAYIADTDRCFHLGSRKATAPRHILVIQYYSPFAFVLPSNWEEVLPLAHLAQDSHFTNIEKLVLGKK
ncbi:hypothetical protein IMCC1989_1770 [gamma proteobacterium IMCC1989]|nr:hypothetical protein IMCC1989_1770 [gamma proteobacterium IMCC1989]